MNDTSNAVELKSVVKRFGDFVAVETMDLTIEQGSFVTLLGPSGCGKTTTLRMVAGLEDASEGDIMIKGQRVNDVPIHKRNLGLVFQNYALFPHKTIRENVAFGLKYRNVDKETAREKVRMALELVQLPHVEDRLPSQLSGGQQQRIALARAIVIEPHVLLLDEPLSALDANLREEMRVELKRIQRELGITTIFVTHDQAEALALSDKVVVMNHGLIEQEGTPEDVYNRPSSEFVANFLGNSNIMAGQVQEARDGRTTIAVEGLGNLAVQDPEHPVTQGQTVKLVVRAEKIFVGKAPEDEGEVSTFPAKVTALDYQGLSARYFVETEGLSLQAINPIDQHPFREGNEVSIAIRARDCVILEKTES